MTEPRIPPAALAEHLDFARRLARGLIDDADARDDAVQDACVAALEGPPRDPARLRGWLATVMRRLSQRRRRTDARRSEREARVARTSESPPSDDLVAAMDVHRRVVDALMDQPEPYRRTLLLHYFDDLTVTEIAAQEGEPVETVRTRLRRGLARLRRELDVDPEHDRDSWLPALAPLVRSAPAKRRWLWRTVAAAAAVLVFGLASFLTGGGREALMAYYEQPEREDENDGVRTIPVAVVGPTRHRLDDSERAERMAAALRAPLEEIEAIALPIAAQRALVAEATQTTDDELRRVELFLATSNQVELRLALVPIDSSEVDSDELALIALTAEHELFGAAVVDADLGHRTAWDHFLGLFEYADVPRLEGARPRAWLAERRTAAVAAPDDPESELVLALLDLQRFMNEQASVFNLPQDGSRALEDELDMMREQYTKVAELAPTLRPLFGDSVDEVKRLALDSADGATAMKAAVADGDQATARTIQQRVMGNCRNCHFLPGEAYAGRLADASAAARAKLEIGNGFYQIGHDVRIGHTDREAAQRVADALRIGALMIDAE